MNFKLLNCKIVGKLLFLACFSMLSLVLTAQNITIKCSNEPLKEVLNKLSDLSKYKFVFSNEIKAIDLKVSISSNNEPVETVMQRLFNQNGISYSIKGNQVVLSKGLRQVTSAKIVTVKGIIRYETGEPVIGATVKNAQSKKFTSADLDGTYNIEAAAGDILVVSSIGMADYSFTTSNEKSVYDIVLKHDAIALDEVVVTGYQTISKERATGSFVKVGAEELKIKPVTNISNALNGLTPGMASSTDANGTTRFLIRGQGTLQGADDRDPLIVVDGFPIRGFSGSTGYAGEKDPFASINPNDVESITVLKDAAATSIYGARAANGVIVITTKKGRMGEEKLNVNVSAFVSVSSKPNLDYAFNMANTEETVKYLENIQKYAISYTDSWKNPYNSSNQIWGYLLPDAAALLLEYKTMNHITEAEYKAGIAKLLKNDGKWHDEYNKYIFRNSLKQQYNIALNGGSTKNRYNLSLAYDRDLSMSIGDNQNRVVVNFSNDYKVLKKLTFTIGVNAQLSNTNRNGIGFGELKTFTTPYTTLFNEDGSYAHVAAPGRGYMPILKDKFGDKIPVSWNYNPLEDREFNKKSSKLFNTRFQAGLNYNIIEGLNVSVKGQYERNQFKNRSEQTPGSFVVRNMTNLYSKLNNTTGKYDSYFPAGAIFSESSDLYTAYNLRAQVDYNKQIAGKHDITVLLGGELQSASTQYDPSYTRYGYNENTNAVMTNPDYFYKDWLNNGTWTYKKNIFDTNVYSSPFAGLGGLRNLEDRFISAYLNLAYTFNGKYTITGNARTDASNYVSDEVRDKFSPFWSVGAAWNISKESFVKDIKWINNLKLRGSYGIAGVAAGKSSVSTLTTLGTGSPNIIYTNNEAYSYINLRGNPSLTWEKSKSLDIAVEFDLFNDKLYGALDYYRRYSYDVLAQASMPYIAQSTASITYNNAEISNNGIEISLGSFQKITDKITWKGDLNFSYNKNRIEKYNVIPSYYGGTYVPGRPLGMIFSYNLIGYTPEGFIIMQGKDGKQEIVKDRSTTHLYDNLKPGEGFEDSNWLIYQGTSVPPCILGFTNTFKIYDFTLSFMVTGNFGHLVQDTDTRGSNDQRTPYFGKGIVESMSNDYSGSYRYMPIYNDKNVATYNLGFAYSYMTNLHSSASSNFVSGSYIRLDEVFLGYDMPKSWFGGNDGFIKSLNVYAQAKNLGLIWAANGRGFDPVYNFGSIKPLTTFTFGAKLNF